MVFGNLFKKKRIAAPTPLPVVPNLKSVPHTLLTRFAALQSDTGVEACDWEVPNELRVFEDKDHSISMLAALRRSEDARSSYDTEIQTKPLSPNLPTSPAAIIYAEISPEETMSAGAVLFDAYLPLVTTPAAELLSTGQLQIQVDIDEEHDLFLGQSHPAEALPTTDLHWASVLEEHAQEGKDVSSVRGTISPRSLSLSPYTVEDDICPRCSGTGDEIETWDDVKLACVFCGGKGLSSS